MNRVTGVAVAVGAIAGAVVALSAGPAPKPSSAPERRIAPALVPSSATTQETLPVAPSSPVELRAAPAARPAVTTAAGGAGPQAPAFDLTPPSTREELYQVELRCVRKIPEDCERAARSLAAGNVLPMDQPRARQLRRAALTIYVKQCEADRAIACSRLAEMHEVGEFVQKNVPHARTLRARAVELCSRKPAQPGCPTSG